MLMLKNNCIRTFFQIPEPIVHPESPGPKVGFIEAAKNSYKSAMEEAETRAKAIENQNRAEAMSKMKIPKRRK
jgi:hypothetical protein